MISSHEEELSQFLLQMLQILNVLTEYVVGIDLGTTFSAVAVSRGGQIEVIANEIGNRITPSYVQIVNGEKLVGDSAKNQAADHPENTIYDVKRLIGRRFSDESVQNDIKHLSYKVVNVSDKPMIEIKDEGKTKQYSPEQISALILQKMRQIAEDYLGETVNKAIVTVPAYFSDAQRSATKDAGRIAGLEVIRIINEPTAASIAYGLDKKGDQTVLVFDFGGGTHDVSLLQIQKDDSDVDGDDTSVFSVIATSGDTHLGGEDLDREVLKYFTKIIKQKYNIDLTEKRYKRSQTRLRREIENAKRILSTAMTTKVEVEDLVDGIDFSETLTRSKFEEICDEWLKKTIKPVEKVLADAKLTTSDIDQVILVGGSTRIPKVQQLLKDFFGKEPNHDVHPDEAVAIGAAIQAAALSGQSDHDILLIDVIPLTLGIETVGGVMTPLVDRNTYIPVKKTKTFSTVQDGQTQTNISIYEGERAMVKDNNLLGSFMLEGIPAMQRGQPQIDVTFDIDANGILTVSAVEKSSGMENEITIKNDRNRLSEEEIEKLVKEAEDAAEEDKKLRDIALLKNQLEMSIYEVRGKIDEEKDNNILDTITDDDKESLEQALDDINTWLKENSEDASKEDWEQKVQDFDNATKPIIRKYVKEEEKTQGSGKQEDDFEFKDEL